MSTNLARTRSAGMFLRLVAVATLSLVAWASPAAAHGGPALIEVGDPEPAGERTVTFPIRMTFEADGHDVEQAQGLTVSGKGPDGAELAPVEAFAPGDAPGVFVATVTLPVEGTWELAVDSIEPPGSATLTAEVTGPQTTTTVEGGSDDGPSDTAPDDLGDAPGAAPGDTSDGAGSGDEPDEATDTAGATDAGDDDGGIPIYAIVIAVIAAAGAAVVGYRWSTSRA